MCRSLWQTPAAFTLISTCVPAGGGVGCSTSVRGVLNSATWKLLMVSLPVFLLLHGPWQSLDAPRVFIDVGRGWQAAARRRAPRRVSSHYLAAAAGGFAMSSARPASRSSA